MGNYYLTTKDFAKKYVAPYSVETDQTGEFPVETFKELGNQNYFELLIPKELGGAGKGLPEHAEVCMALAEENPSVGLCYMMHNVALMCVLTHGTPEMKDKICKDVISNKAFLALAYSEFGSGVHFYQPEMTVKSADEITVLNGKKSMVTSATYASYYLVLSPSVSEQEEINNWLIPLEREGVTFQTEKWHGMGMKGNVSCPMILDDVKLTDTDRIGNEGSGMDQVLNVVAPFFITGLAAVYSGVCVKLNELAIEHANNRIYPDGKSLAKLDGIQTHLASIYTKAIASKTLTFEAAKSGAMGKEDALAKILAARIQASEAAIECGRLAMRVGGGKAYNQSSPIERYLRDAYAGQIMAPSVDVLNLWLGKAVTGQQIP